MEAGKDTRSIHQMAVELNDVVACQEKLIYCLALEISSVQQLSIGDDVQVCDKEPRDIEPSIITISSLLCCSGAIYLCHIHHTLNPYFSRGS